MGWHTDMMSKLSARELIASIANSYIELSYDKAMGQRDEYIKWCKAWLANNPETDIVEPTKFKGCSKCGIGEPGNTWGYVCNRQDCPVKIIQS